MKDYVFLFNDEQYKLVEKEKLKVSEANDLVNKGFSRADFKAKNKKDAIYKANELTGVNLKHLKDFSRNIGFSAIIESLLR